MSSYSERLDHPSSHCSHLEEGCSKTIRPDRANMRTSRRHDRGGREPPTAKPPIAKCIHRPRDHFRARFAFLHARFRPLARQKVTVSAQIARDFGRSRAISASHAPCLFDCLFVCWFVCSCCFWEHLHYLGVFGSVWEYLGVSGCICEHLGVSGSIGASGSIWKYLRPSGSIWEHRAAYWSFWKHLGASASLVKRAY